MKVDVIIFGSAGFGGGELLRYLVGHPDVVSIQAISTSFADQPVISAHPHLHNFSGQCFKAVPDCVGGTAAQSLVVFSAMPNGELAAMYEEFCCKVKAVAGGKPTLVVDLSGDFRLGDAASFNTAYGSDHPCPGQLAHFVYGLPEYNAKAIAQAKDIANPGCFATAINLALLPFCGIGNLGLVAVSGCTGSSGSGAIPKDTTHHPTRAHDFLAYKMLHHQHQSEVEMLLDSAGTTGYKLGFVPHSAPMVRGIFVTAQFILPAQVGENEVASLVHGCYENASFVQVVDGSPRVAATLGSNYAQLGYATSGGIVAVMCALDNLGKGMAGQAVQNMNIALGLDETTGLTQAAVYP